jgi:hypothetical protein
MGEPSVAAHELDVTLAAAGEANARFVKALMEFGCRFPGDQRRFDAMDATDHERVAFEVAQAEVSGLKAEADVARGLWDLERQRGMENVAR